jgi:hypothetical protein
VVASNGRPLAGYDALVPPDTEGANATEVPVPAPTALEVDRQGRLCIATAYQSSTGYLIRRVDADRTIHTLAGGGSAPMNADGVPARDAKLGSVYGLAITASGDLILADYTSRRLRVVEGLAL